MRKTTTSNLTYHIIGGGIAGLFCAQILKIKSPKAKVVVYEANSQLGGRCYSYQDKEFGLNLDNATHVIIGANKYLKRFVLPNEWEPDIGFWDAKTNSVSYQYKANLEHIMKSACNLEAEKIAPEIRKKILRSTFPWGYNQRKIYFSKQNLSQRIINNLIRYHPVLW